MIDPDFQEKLFSNPEKLGKIVGLNESGIKIIKNIDNKIFSGFLSKLDSKLIKDAAEIIFCAAY